jgi:hypothetical protein
MEMKLGHQNYRCTAIQGAGPLAGVIGVGWDRLGLADIEEVVELDHVARHVIRPFQNLGANVNKEGVARPAA